MSWLTKPANPKWTTLALILAFVSVDIATRIQGGNFTLRSDDIIVYITMVVVTMLIFIKFNFRLVAIGDAQADRRLAPLWPTIVSVCVGAYILFSILHALKFL